MHEPTTMATAADTLRATEALEGHRAEADLASVLREDPRVLQILSTEHWSLLSARSLAYNEALTRAGMFLSFLSMSFVALALVAQAMPFNQDFLLVAGLVLAFDLIIGVLSFGRIMDATLDDLRALHGMSRIRHGYVEITPVVAPYFTTSYYDDPAGVFRAYSAPEMSHGLRAVAHGLTTSSGMVGLIVSLVSGVLAGVVALALGWTGGVVLVAAGLVTLVVVLALIRWAHVAISHSVAALPVRFPTPVERAGEPLAEPATGQLTVPVDHPTH